MKSLSECPIGSFVRERVEDFKAMVVGHQIHIDGCHRVVLQEKRLKDGKPVPLETIDVQRVELIKIGNGPVMKPVDDIIGLKAEDIATGYKGTICVIQTDASGARDFMLQSDARTATKDRVDPAWISENRLKLLEPLRKVKQPEASKPLPAGRGAVNAPMKAENPI